MIEDGPTKPAFNAPCNGCGLCCVATACGLAIDLVPGAEFGRPCPALEWEGGRSWCGMIRRPFHHSPRLADAAAHMKPDDQAAASTLLAECVAQSLGGVGRGCDSGPDDPADDRFVGMTARQYLAPAGGIEPPTSPLRGERSTS